MVQYIRVKGKLVHKLANDRMPGEFRTICGLTLNLAWNTIFMWKPNPKEFCKKCKRQKK
jgi:hypothetical protein